MKAVLVSERATPIVNGLPRVLPKSAVIHTYCISVPRKFLSRQKYFAIEILPAELIDDEDSYKIAGDSLVLMGFLMSSLFPIWVNGLSPRQQFGKVSAKKHYNTFPFPDFSKHQEKEIVERVNTVNKARSTIGGKLLSDIYIGRELDDHLEMAHEDLDEVVLKVFGLPADASNSEIFDKLIAEYNKLNKAS